MACLLHLLNFSNFLVQFHFNSLGSTAFPEAFLAPRGQNVPQFHFPLTAGLETAARCHFSHPKQILDFNYMYTHHLMNFQTRYSEDANLV